MWYDLHIFIFKQKYSYFTKQKIVLYFISLKIKIKTVRPGDTVRSLSNHSSISVGLEKWFRALNGLEDDDNLIVGQTVKLIVR